jgi:Phage ABA sandwich domain
MELREIDRLVAEKVMGCSKELMVWLEIHEVLPHYSTNIVDAWQVVEKFVNDDIYFEMVKPDKDGSFTCLIGMLNEPTKADTAPLAICLAALKAHGIDVNKS